MDTRLSMVLRTVIAVILIQTLWYKFTGAEESVYIFSQVGLEPQGRIGIALLELIAAVLIMIPKYIWAGAAMTGALISGAVAMHLTKLGIEVMGDGGVLFYTALLVLFLSLIVLWSERSKIPMIGKMIKVDN